MAINQAPAVSTIPELMRDKTKLEAEIQAQKPFAVARVMALMEELGLAWSDFGVAPAVSPPPPVKRKVKYRDDEGNTWTGIGQRPRWLRAKVQAGATLEQFRIPGA